MFSRRSTPTGPEDPTAGQRETLGSYLSEARLAQGLDLTTIAEETRVSIQNLIALEEDNRPALPADVFSRGFVKIYAAYLRLDPQEALSRYHRQWGDTPPSLATASPVLRAQSPPAWTWSGLIIIFILFALVIGGRLISPSPADDNDPPGLAHIQVMAAARLGSSGSNVFETNEWAGCGVYIGHRP